MRAIVAAFLMLTISSPALAIFALVPADRVDEVPVWSLTCFYKRKGYRKLGVTRQLIAAAV